MLTSDGDLLGLANIDPLLLDFIEFLLTLKCATGSAIVIVLRGGEEL